MKVLGIDPGIGRVGWAVLEKNNLLGYGCIETPPKSSLSSRLVTIHTELTKTIDRYHPNQAAIENLFFEKNAKTAIPVGAGRGVAILTCALKNLPIFDYTPLQIKSAIAGNGKADKKAVEFMVCKLLKLDKAPKPDDTVDAIAIALTHLATSYVTINP